MQFLCILLTNRVEENCQGYNSRPHFSKIFVEKNIFLKRFIKSVTYEKENE